MDTQTPHTKADLLDRVRRAHAALEQIISGLSDAQLANLTTDGGWSIKDHLAHIVDWEQILLRAHIGGETYNRAADMPDNVLVNTVDELNDWLTRRSRSRAAAEVRGAFAQSYQQVLAALEALSEADLFAQMSRVREGHPLLRAIADNTWEHYDEHATTLQQIVADIQPESR